MERTTDMTKGNPTQLILRFSLPLMLGNLGQQLYMVVDAIIVGRGVGVEAFASLGATDWASWMVLWSIQGFTQGFAILIAQAFGADDFKMVKKSVTMSTLLCAVIGILMTIISLVGAKPLLLLMKTPTDIFDGSYAYITTLFAGSIIVMGYNMAASILRSFGDGKSPLIAMAVAAGINILLDLLFVLVFNWGIVGAAAATIAAQLCSLLYCIAVIRHLEMMKLKKEDWQLDKATLLRLWRFGLPLAVQQSVIAIGGMILQTRINRCGLLFVAGFTATNKLYGLLESSAISFGFATTTFMGQNLGAGKIDRIDTGMKSVVRLAFGVSIAISVLMVLFGKNILWLFVSKAEASAHQVIDLAYQYLLVMSVLLSILYLLHAYRSALQGLGNTFAPMVSGIIEFIMRSGSAFIIPLLFGEYGLFFAEPLAWGGAAVFLILSYYGEARRIKNRRAVR